MGFEPLILWTKSYTQNKIKASEEFKKTKKMYGHNNTDIILIFFISFWFFFLLCKT